MPASFMGELLGTMILILLGDGVVAGVLLNKSKAQNAGWINARHDLPATIAVTAPVV